MEAKTHADGRVCRSCISGASVLSPGNSAEGAAVQEVSGAFGEKEAVEVGVRLCGIHSTIRYHPHLSTAVAWWRFSVRA